MSWIKLHRELLNNDLFNDRVALHIFLYLLLKCDEKGRVRVSRYVTSGILGMNPETFRKGLERLKQHQRIAITSTNKFSIVSIVNWTSYQQGGTNKVTNRVPTKYQHSTTLYKNRIEKNKDRFKIKPPEGHVPYGGLESIADGSN